MPVAIACAVAASDPALRGVGDIGVVVAGVGAFVVLWHAGGRAAHHRRSWRFLAAGPLFPAIGAVLTALVDPPDPLHVVVLRWVFTVPGYVLAIVGLLTLVDRARLRAGGLRLAVEAALFTGACLVVVQLLVIGPEGRWLELALGERLVLGAAVVVTTVAMAAALTLLGVIEATRQSMAFVLLVGAMALTAGRGLGTSAMLAGALPVVDMSRLLVVAGLTLLVLAGLMDTGPGVAEDGSAVAGPFPELGQLLPHVAMLLAAVAVATVALSGARPGPTTVATLVVCAALAVFHRWVTAREGRRMAARLRRSEAYFRSLVRSSGDAVVILDDALRISWASTALERALGPIAAQLSGRRLLDVVHPEDVATLTAALPADTPSPEESAGTGLLLLRLQDADGVWRYLEAGVSDLRHDADVGAVVLHCRDMTDRHERERALQSVAYTDPMTGLPNRAGVLRSLRHALSDPATEPRTLLMIQLDGLAAARDNVGREVVSAVVTEAGRRLRATVRGEDVVARMGGGAFAVLTAGTDGDADRLAARCLSVIEAPVPSAAGIIDLTASVGLVRLEEGLDVDVLLGRADLAVRAARSTGVGQAARYEPAFGEAAARRERLRTDLQGARARGELFLIFQPIVALQEQRITGLEAMLRWRHPTLGEILPAEFIPLGEKAGLIGELVRGALEQAAAAVLTLPAADEPLRIGMKVPAGYVAGGTIVADVEHVLRSSGLAAERLVLQIGATSLTSDDEHVPLDISTLRLMGVHVALDGFGSGTSDLSHLTRLPIDIVRLDRSFITRLDRDPQSRALCESVVGIGQALGLAVVADGVETPAQLAALCGFGCDYAQGFLISRPVPLGGLTALLADGSGQLWPGLVASR